jgi:predicted small metal-binding protein
MTKTYSYACADFPGMEACPAHFTTETEDQLWNVINLHAKEAHGEDPSEWPAEDIATVKNTIKVDG